MFFPAQYILPGNKSVKQRSNTNYKINNDVDPEKCWLIFFRNLKTAFDADNSLCDTFIPEPNKGKPDDRDD